MKRPGRKRGFTLIELLSALAVISVLVALLFPAVQRVRELATRLKCQNNMKQIGLALHGYESAHRKFPPGFSEKHNMIPYILPELEQANAVRGYDFKLMWDSTYAPPGGRSNRSIGEVDIPVLQCPGAPDGRAGLAVNDYPVSDFISPELYRVMGIERTQTTFPFTKPASVASFFGRDLGKQTTLDSVTDGLSNTFMLFEDVGRPMLWLNGQRIPAKKAVNHQWADPENRITVQTSPECNRGKVFFNCGNNNEIYSFHSGISGANFLLADGSVRFVRDSIPGPVFKALYTRAGGEVAPGDY